MLLGFAITRHCNLRCPHCIRDDVESVHELEPEFIGRVVDEARELWGDVHVSMTGGEPLVHRGFDAIVHELADRGVPYNFVSNGWHIRRTAPLLRKHRPYAVRLSLSGATEEVHDAERGRGSFRRVLEAVAVLTSLQVPTSLSIVIDRRDRDQIRMAADLAEGLGCNRIHFILPQPVPDSVARDSDFELADWWVIAREVRALAREPGRRTVIQLDYGAPMEPGEEVRCYTFALERVYVDVEGRLSTCCQLSEYGNNEADVVADLHTMSLASAWPLYREALLRQEDAAASRPDDPLDPFPCMRCARATNKLDWLSGFPGTVWGRALGHHGRRALPVLR